MKRNYDTIAFFYDRLARLVYGKTLVNAQRYLLSAVPARAHILIAGGGTGWILEELAKTHESGLTIDYIDASGKMIALAEKRNIGNNKVTFITSQIEDVQLSPEGYDVVITPFLFDNFTDSTLEKVFPVIDRQLKKDGAWLFCDFADTKILWQKAVLQVMYAFFRLSCGIEASHLPDTAGLFSWHGYKVCGQKTFMKEFIVARIYKRA